ncbi:MAG: RNA-binding protein [Chitinophagaceae bacterium]|nr:RNA-binding protein [Chitinophagaceae bacterium]
MNIYVSNLSFNVQDEDLRSYFAEYGDVSSAKVITDKFTQRSKGFGFVEMSDDAAAQKAIAELDGAMVDGRSIKVMIARPKEERPQGGGNGGYGGGGNRRPGGGGGGSRW